MIRKALITAACLAVAGCAAADCLQGASSDAAKTECFQVFTVYDDSALARKCMDKFQTETARCYGMDVIIPARVDPEMYSDKIVCLKNPKLAGRIKQGIKVLPVFENGE